MKSKWLIVALVVSIIANLALVGFLFGVASGPPQWLGRSFDTTAGLGRLMRFLPEQRREELLGEGVWRQEFRTSLRNLRRAQRGIHQALAAEPFDREALATALSAFHEHFVASQGRSHVAFVDVVAKLTPEERKQFVATLRLPRGGRHGDRPRRGDRDRSPPPETSP